MIPLLFFPFCWGGIGLSENNMKYPKGVTDLQLMLGYIYMDSAFIYFKIIYLFIKNDLIYFNWGLITLQYCSGLCHTLTWINHGCTCLPHPESHLQPPSPSHPSGSSQCTSPEHFVSCIEPGLAISCTYNIHVSMLLSQIIPVLPSPTESKRLFYTSVSLLLSRI